MVTHRGATSFLQSIEQHPAIPSRHVAGREFRQSGAVSLLCSSHQERVIPFSPSQRSTETLCRAWQCFSDDRDKGGQEKERRILPCYSQRSGSVVCRCDPNTQ